MSVIPPRVLSRFFLKPLLVRILLCCAVLCGLLEVLALLEQAGTILSRHLGMHGLFKFMLLHLPALMTEIMPLSVMIGSLFTLLQMALSSEIAIMRAAGLSTFEMFRLLLPVPILLGLLTMAVQFWVVPPCEQELTTWWNQTATAVHDTQALPALWFREGSAIVHVEQVSTGGKHLQDVSVFQREKQTGILTAAYHFPALQRESSHWISAPGATAIRVAPDQESAEVVAFTQKVFLPTTPRQIMAMTMDSPIYTPGEILKVLHRQAPASLPISNYRMTFFSALFLPLEMAVMLLITLPVTYIPPRAGIRNPLPVYVMAAGLGIVILQGMISALGNAGSLPVLLAVCSAQLVAALLGLGWILRMEDK
ncbi:LptF/LptG family permease [Oecophyllibacter saccharovorans]|uniref:YjgP/YjgQ family permease n=1 Tax=Oecophyllibacter saccharovorans TaxID=2558360 RepID=A0A506UQQ0_9PROT|nr:LptF/LptG family permease [Oecophyllibacter saccharovorans]TPW35668.1 YjgP/YjgQ family permease [Oecophyllibacter saccharovorans]